MVLHGINDSKFRQLSARKELYKIRRVKSNLSGSEMLQIKSRKIQINKGKISLSLHSSYVVKCSYPSLTKIHEEIFNTMIK